MVKKTKKEEVVPEAEAPEVATPKVKDARAARWEAFLAKLENDAAKNGTSHIFEAQKKNGEFNAIPADFV